MIKINNLEDIISIDEFGGKSYWLSWLKNRGYNVPYAIFISAINNNEIDSIDNINLDKELLPFLSDKQYSIAIRSSGIVEDSSNKSYAGHYKTFIGNFSYSEVISKIKKVIKSNNISNNKMGVIIQHKIESKYSGVIFSSNVLNSSKKEALIGIVKGMGDNLVSGKESGETIIINKIDNSNTPNNKYGIANTIIREIVDIAVSIEKTLHFPVDIEWSIDDENNIHILQCRPITSFTNYKSGILEITPENENYIPKDVLAHDKVMIRLVAQKNNINMSKAYLAIIPHTIRKINLDFQIIKPEKHIIGFSTVLVYPTNINGKIVRYFSKTEINKHNILYRNCYREKVKTLENITSLPDVLIDIGNKSSHYSWLSVIIIQELYKPQFTGIIKSIDEGYLIEIAKGFFLQKGLVTPSQYIINYEKKLIYQNEIYQNEYYNIDNGEIEKRKLEEKISISIKSAISIIDEFQVLLNEKNKAIEFGLLSKKDNLIPYLIDFIEDSVTTNLSSEELSNGIVSKGVVTGKLITNIKLDNNSINLHFHDDNNVVKKQGNYIFMYKNPDIALLKLLDEYNNENIGFIFEEASILAHLPIVLRERNIPAIVANEIKFNNGDIIQIDTISQNIEIDERIKKIY